MNELRTRRKTGYKIRRIVIYTSSTYTITHLVHDGYVLISFDNFIHSMQRLDHSETIFIIINECYSDVGSLYLCCSYTYPYLHTSMVNLYFAMQSILSRSL